MMKVKFLLSTLWCLCLLSCAPLIFFGAGTATGVGAFKYYQGALIVVYEAPYIETWDAALRALQNMSLEIRSQKHDLTAGKIEAVRADKNPVTLAVEYKNAKQTEVTIRIGLFGDKDASLAIKDKISQELFKG